jgi:uncharacterized membrane protein YfcA
VFGTDDWLSAALIAFVVASITTPAGVSGALLLLPVQLSVFHVANPTLTPTNLLYNVVATPGSLLRFARGQSLASRLTRSLVVGAVPGVVLGAVLRVEVLHEKDEFLLVVAAVLAPVGLVLLLGGFRPPSNGQRDPGRAVPAIAFCAGCIGGIYGLGGGSLLAPALAALGYSLYAVAPAALTSTFLTSIAGVTTFLVLDLLKGDTAIAPDWGLGISMGIGGLAGGYVGAHIQPHISEDRLRQLLGGVCLVLAACYAVAASAAPDA